MANPGKLWAFAACILVTTLLAGCSTPDHGKANAAAKRKAHLHGTFGTYSGEPRLSSGRVDVRRLADELSEINAQTYNWLIWHKPTDWEDLHEFLPLAQERKIKVWVTLVPPSESPPKSRAYSEPYRLDYERWAVEIARLSLRHSNLVAWSIDDFSHNGKVFTSERLGGMLSEARSINPRLAFVPCIYYRHATAEFARTYSPLLDGILFPFRNESVKMNLQDYESLEREVANLRALFGGTTPIFVDVYATKHSRLNDATPDYVKQVMLLGRKSADGVLIYCHQSKSGSPEKYGVIKEVFSNWAAHGY